MILALAGHVIEIQQLVAAGVCVITILFLAVHVIQLRAWVCVCVRI